MPPLEAEAKGETAGAGYVFDSMTHFGRTDIVTLLDYRSKEDPSDAALLMERRERVANLLTGLFLPSFIRFRDAAMDCGEWGLVPLSSIKRVIIAYIYRGYVGDVRFNSGYYQRDQSQIPAKVEVHTSNWKEWFPRPSAEAKFEYLNGKHVFDTPRIAQPPLVKISVDRRYGGKKQDVQPVLDVCQSLGLEELDPTEIKSGSSYAEDFW